MQRFFDLTEHNEILIPMYGVIHIITFFVMLSFIPLVILKKTAVKKLVSNRKFMIRFMIMYMCIDFFYWILIWSYKVEPIFERFPLHLCATLSMLLPIFVLAGKYNLLRFFSYWSVCAGFISLVNPSYVHDAPLSFAFIHYLIRHYFLFLFPIFIHVGKDFTYSYKEFLKSTAALAGYAFLIFLLDWATGANYMHLGKSNPLQIPFLPGNFTKWPWSYPSFVGVGIILLHIVYFIFTIKKKINR